MRAISRLTVPFLVIITLGLGVASCSQSSKSSNDLKQAPITVEVGYPSSNTSSTFSVSGKVEARKSANISTRLMGYITKIYVKVGDKVKEGQLVATIDSRDVMAKRAQSQAMVTEAEEAFKNAEKDYKRYQELFNQQSASEKELENMKLQYTSSKARLEASKQARAEANAMLSYAQIKAPYSGTITQKNADEGSMATPGMTILTLEQAGELRIRAILPENSIGNINRGDQVLVSIKSADKAFKSRINELSTSSLNTGNQYEATIDVPQSDKIGLFSGQYANITIVGKSVSTTTSEHKILIPQSSIIRKEQLTGVYIVSNRGTALLRWIRLGSSTNDQVEVLAGLTAKEKIVTKSNGKLYNGAPVLVK